MTQIDIVPATLDHAKRMAPNLRQADVDEILAASRSRPLEALEKSLEFSREAWTALVDGEPACMWGAGPLGIFGGTGGIWLLGTDVIEKHPKKFLIESRRFLEIISTVYIKLSNYVDARNTVSLRWLKWLGFEISEPEPFGAEGLPFHKIEMRFPDV